jgi:hypothetical protein
MRLTENEYDQLRSDAKRAGLPLSTYMRFMMKACRPKQNRPPDWFKFHRQLCAIGNNLNQIAHVAHITGNIDAEKLNRFRKGLEEVLIALVAEMYEPEQLEKTAIIQRMKEQGGGSYSDSLCRSISI